MLHNRGAGGPKQRKWKKTASEAFRGFFFGKRSGQPLPGGLLDDTELAETFSAGNTRQLATTAVAWDARGAATLRMRLEARSPVPEAGDEDLYEALLFEPLLLDDDAPASPTVGAVAPSQPQLLHAIATQTPSAPAVGPSAGAASESAGAAASESAGAAAEQVGSLTPLEKKIEDTRALVKLLVQAKAQGVKSQGDLAGRLGWSTRDLSNFLTGKGSHKGQVMDRTRLGRLAASLLADLARCNFMTELAVPTAGM